MSARTPRFWATRLPLLVEQVRRHTRADYTIDWQAIALAIPGATANACRFKWAEVSKSPPASPPVTFTDASSPITCTEFPSPSGLTAPPFAVPLPQPAVMQQGGGLVAVVCGDTHFGAEDPAAIAVALGIIQEAQPDVVVHVGDLLDAYWISRWDHDIEHTTRLQDEIDRARVFLHQVAQLVPQARRVLLEGNHEARLTKAIWGMPGTAAEIAKLTAFRQAITWPSLLQLDEIGWEWISEKQQTKTTVLPGLITKHGTVVRKWSGASARGEWERYGASGCSGHTHRLGCFYHWHHVWVETGCLCSVDPEYVMDPDWQQGLLVVTYAADNARFNVEPVYISEGRAVWRGREFVA